tara:strand:- start:48 stop:500 length:453 start_codon:yes stop_codon:yes gene_type:complete
MANKNYNTKGNSTKPKGPKARGTKRKSTGGLKAEFKRGSDFIKQTGSGVMSAITKADTGFKKMIGITPTKNDKGKRAKGPDPLKLANPKKSKKSFGEAFKAAKKAGVKEFEYNGKKYAATTKDEVKKAGFKDGKKDLKKYLNTKLGNKAR